MVQLALMRHGQSEWNLQNRFTGWWDVQLTEKGEAEATHAGELLSAADVDFRQCFTSVQTRAIRTVWLALHSMDRCWLPVTTDDDADAGWRLASVRRRAGCFRRLGESSSGNCCLCCC